MQINFHSHEHPNSNNAPVTVLALTGRVDAHTVPQLQNRIQTVSSAKPSNLIIDLSAVDFMDSSGLAALVQGMRRCQATGGRLCLSNPQQPVRMVLELTRLDKAIRIFASEQEAIASFFSSKGALREQ